jgi:uncharacterized DUF497 family protein
MNFEWDHRKAKSNLSKHGVSFDDATTVFSDPLAVTFVDRAHSDAELRFLTFGLMTDGKPVVVSHVDRAGNIRIISARLMTPRERSQYERY